MGVVIPLLLLACRGPAPTDTATPHPSPPLDAAALLARASLDVRGRRPTAAELDAVEADPDALPGLLDAVVDDPAFGWRYATRLGRRWQTRADASDAETHDFALPDEVPVLTALGEEPLRMVAYVADADLPWTTLLTADWTMVNDTLAPWYPVDDPGGPGWRPAPWTDGRPAAGMLATNGLWWRFPTTLANANRGRANAVGRLLVCEDHLDRAVPFDADAPLLDADAVEAAIRTDPGCVSCHASLDPVGAAAWGFYHEHRNDLAELSRWHPEQADAWRDGGVAPGWYGAPAADLAALARLAAADRRFVRCSVESAWAALLDRPPTLADEDTLTALRETFLTEGLAARPLVRALLDTPAYRDLDAPHPLDADGYASAVEALTGARLALDGHDVIEDDAAGLRSLADGGRATFDQEAASGPTPPLLAVQERIAEAGAAYAVAAGTLPPDLDPRVDADDVAVRGALGRLHRVVYSRAATDEELDAWAGLYADVRDAGADPAEAWAAVIAAMLRSPAFGVY